VDGDARRIKAHLVKGGLFARRMRWPLANELRRQTDVECSGPDCAGASEILELVRADLPLLNEARPV
jgi:hypothetical protein